jgi:hypothetical protein
VAGSEGAGGPLEKRFASLKETAHALVAKRDAALCAREFGLAVDGLVRDGTVAKLMAAPGGDPIRREGCCGGEMVVRLGGERETLRRTSYLARLQLYAIARRHGRQEAFEGLPMVVPAEDASALRRVFGLLSAARTPEERARALDSLDPKYRKVMALVGADARWSAQDRRSWEDCVREAQSLSADAMQDASRTAVAAAEILIDLARVGENEGLLGEALGRFKDAANAVLPPGEVGWRILQTADAHRDADRFDLAMDIYALVEPGDAETPRPDWVAARLRTFSAMWSAAELQGERPADDQDIWAVLAGVAPRLRWHERIEEDFIAVMRRCRSRSAGGHEHLGIVDPILALLVCNATSQDVRFQAAMSRGVFRERLGRRGDAAQTYRDSLQHITDPSLQRELRRQVKVAWSGVIR